MHSSGHTYRCGNINEEGVAVHTHYLQERVGDNVHHFTVPPHQEPPESKGNKPSICINGCCCYGHWKYNKKFNVWLRIPARINAFSLKLESYFWSYFQNIKFELLINWGPCVYIQFTPTTWPALQVSLKVKAQSIHLTLSGFLLHPVSKMLLGSVWKEEPQRKDTWLEIGIQLLIATEKWE